MNIIIHAGFHKTGTTYLQSVFNCNRKLLKSNGVYVPEMHAKDNAKGSSVSGHDAFVSEILKGKSVEDILGSEIASTKVVFISSENLTHPFTPYKLERFLGQPFFKDYAWERIDIVFTYKNPFDLLASHFIEINSNGLNKKRLSFAQFIMLKIKQLSCLDRIVNLSCANAYFIESNDIIESIFNFEAMSFCQEMKSKLDFDQGIRYPSSTCLDVFDDISSDVSMECMRLGEEYHQGLVKLSSNRSSSFTATQRFLDLARVKYDALYVLESKLDYGLIFLFMGKDRFLS